MTTRQDIVDAVKAALELIATTYGFNSDLGTNVSLNRKAPYDKNETLPGCNIHDPEDEHVQFLVSGTDLIEDRRLKLPVDVFAVTDNDEAARELVQDVLAAIGTDETFGGIAIRTEIEEPERLDVQHFERKVAGSRIPLVIYYRKKVWGDLSITLPSFDAGYDLGFQS